MLVLKLFLMFVAAFGVGADWGSTRAALASGWMKEVGWCAVRCGIPFTVFARGAIVLVALLVMGTPGLPAWADLGAGLAAFATGATGIRVAVGNVRRLWRAAGI